jgi:hypothetical protein
VAGLGNHLKECDQLFHPKIKEHGKIMFLRISSKIMATST